MNEREQLPPIPVGGVPILGQPQGQPSVEIFVPPLQFSAAVGARIKQFLPQVIGGLQQQIDSLKQQNRMQLQQMAQLVYRAEVLDECLTLVGFSQDEFDQAKEAVNEKVQKQREQIAEAMAKAQAEAQQPQKQREQAVADIVAAEQAQPAPQGEQGDLIANR